MPRIVLPSHIFQFAFDSHDEFRQITNVHDGCESVLAAMRGSGASTFPFATDRQQPIQEIYFLGCSGLLLSWLLLQQYRSWCCMDECSSWRSFRLLWGQRVHWKCPTSGWHCCHRKCRFHPSELCEQAIVVHVVAIKTLCHWGDERYLPGRTNHAHWTSIEHFATCVAFGNTAPVQLLVVLGKLVGLFSWPSLLLLRAVKLL